MDDAMAQAVDIGEDDVSFISSSFLILLICLQFILILAFDYPTEF